MDHHGQLIQLIHLLLDKMANVINFMNFYEWKFSILIEILPKFVPKGQIDNNSELVQVMARRRIGDKPLSGPMLTQFTDAISGTRGSLSADPVTKRNGILVTNVPADAPVSNGARAISETLVNIHADIFPFSCYKFVFL